jgi:AraC-like DNA-binding protein
MKYFQEKIEMDVNIPSKIYVGSDNSGNCHFPLHWLNNLEFDLVLEGMIVGKINGKEVNITKGDFFFVNNGDLHETDAADKKHMKAITILLSYQLMREYCPDVDRYYFDFTDKLGAKEAVKELILECAQVYLKKREFFELKLSILLRKICLLLLEECKVLRNEDRYHTYEQKSITNVKIAIEYLEKNYENEIYLSSVAAELGMSPNYFSRFFKKSTGETFYDYLVNIRLYYAQKELMNTDASITEIAFNNGFPNVKSLIEKFKRVYGMTPARFRKQKSVKE